MQPPGSYLSKPVHTLAGEKPTGYVVICYVLFCYCFVFGVENPYGEWPRARLGGGPANTH